MVNTLQNPVILINFRCVGALDRMKKKSEKKTKKSERKSDSVLTDDKEDSIALRMKRNERRINQQSDGDDDENTSYEY